MKKIFTTPSVKIFTLELSEHMLAGSDVTSNNETGDKTQLVGKQNKIIDDSNQNSKFLPNL